MEYIDSIYRIRQEWGHWTVYRNRQRYSIEDTYEDAMREVYRAMAEDD